MRREGKASSKERKTLLITALGITVLAVVVIGYNLYQRSHSGEETGSLNKAGLYKEKAREQLQSQSERSDFHFRISGQGTFPEGTSKPGTLVIENPPDNRYRLQVTIKEKDTGEELYRSPVLKPGENINSLSLKKKLNRGNHLATACIKALKETEKTGGKAKTADEEGEASADILLQVE